MNTGSANLRERGGCLTVYLVATILFAILGLLLLFLAGAAVTALNVAGVANGTGTASLSIVPILISIVAIILSIAGVYGAWTWKKWGIYLIVASGIVTALSSILNGNAGSAIIGLAIEIGILWYLVKDKWAAFEG